MTGRPLDDWMLDADGEAGVRRVSGFVPAVTLAIPFVAAWFSHGSSRSDVELLTPATSYAPRARRDDPATVGGIDVQPMRPAPAGMDHGRLCTFITRVGCQIAGDLGGLVLLPDY